MSGAKRASQSRTGASREYTTALQEHLGQITQAQRIAQPPENDEQDDVSGIFEKVDAVAVRSLKVRRQPEQQNVR